MKRCIICLKKIPFYVLLCRECYRKYGDLPKDEKWVKFLISDTRRYDQKEQEYEQNEVKL